MQGSSQAQTLAGRAILASLSPRSQRALAAGEVIVSVVGVAVTFARHDTLSHGTPLQALKPP